jgi:hypothetical protein
LTARDEWRWTDERGVQRLVGTDELRAALASNVLAPSTLVWREGMKEWAPAFTMPELATAAAAAASAADHDEAPPALSPSARREMRTLVGLTSPDAKDRPSAPVVPIVMPGAAKTSGREVITQIPNYDAKTESIDQVNPVIPPAPRMPGRPAGSQGGPPKPLPRQRTATMQGMGQFPRKRTTSDIDSLWASPSASPIDEGDSADDTEVFANGAGGDTKTTRILTGDIGLVGLDAPIVAASSVAAESPAPERVSSTELDELDVVVDDKPAAKPPPAPTTKAPSAAASTAPRRPASRPPPPPPRRPGSIPPASLSTKPPLAGSGRPASSDAKPSTAPVRSAPPLPKRGSTHPSPPRREDGSVGAAPPASTSTPAPEATSTAPPKRALPSPPNRTRTPLGMGAVKPVEARDGNGATPKPTSATTPAAGDVKHRAEEPSADALVAEASSTPAPVAVLVAPVVVSVPPSRPAPALGSATAGAATNDADAAAATAKAADGEADVPAAAASELTPAPGTPEPAAAAHPPVAPILLTKVKDEPSVAAPEITYPLPPPRREDLSGTPTAPVATRAPSSRPPPSHAAASESSRPPSLRPGADDEGTFAPRRPQLRDNVAVPVSSIVIAGAAVIAIAITGFLVGRSSSLGVARARAQRGVAAAFVPRRGGAGASTSAAPRPCFVAKQATMWAERASKSIPFELFASSTRALSVGYARDENEAVGLEVDAASGATKETFTKTLEAPVERVMPNPGGGFTVATTSDTAPLKSVVEGASTPPFFVGVAGGGLSLSSSQDAAGTPLWPLDDADINAARIESGGPAGFGLTFRKGKQVVGGWIGPDKHPVGGLVTVAGSGGDVGKPMSGYNGIDFAVTFADRPAGSDHWEIRAGRAPAGAIPATTSVIPLPKGGPGGDAFAPDLVGLSDGRWLLVWTEGPPGKKAMRAQTLSRDFELVGDPIALSPPGGNYGQGVLGVVGSHTAVVFLSKGSASYELWGAVLSCG